MDQHSHSHSHGHGHPADVDWGEMVAYAELNAEVLIALLNEATSVLAELADAGGLEIRRILDIGSGPGVGTTALAQRFGSATVLAADGSTEMLANVTTRALRLGLADRVQTRVVELPGGLDDLGQFDLVWASLVLHHVGDEADGLRRVRARLEPGGLLALAEFADATRVVPADTDVGRPDVWERLDAAGAAWLDDMRAGLPGAKPSGEYPAMLGAAGFDVLVDRVLTARLDPPLDDRARRAALGHVAMTRRHVEPYADADDVKVLDALLDEDSPAGIMRRPDALLHASRRLIVSKAVRAAPAGM